LAALRYHSREVATVPSGAVAMRVADRAPLCLELGSHFAIG